MQKSMDSRFLKKILTDIEIEQVQRSHNPDATLWAFWACKEAAYKVLNKQTSDAPFVPRRWSVYFRPASQAVESQSAHPSGAPPEDQKPVVHVEGEVIISKEKSIPFFLFSSLSYVHCLAADVFDVLDKAIWRVDVLPEGQDQKGMDPSTYTRSCLAHDLSVFLQVAPRQIEIRRASRKNGELRPPAVYQDGVKTDIDVSLSHDGQFVACAFLP